MSVKNPAVNDPETLELLYWQEGLSMWQMAKRLGVSETTVYRRMRQFNIDRRGVGYTSVNEESDNPVRIRSSRDGYVRVWHSYAGGCERFYLHQLVAVAGGADPHEVFSEEYHTHHKNGVKWDNRPDNLEVMPADEHMRMHASENDFGLERQYSNEEMLSWIQAHILEFGRVPRYDDAECWPGPSPGTYAYRFGNYSRAVEMAKEGMDD